MATHILNPNAAPFVPLTRRSPLDPNAKLFFPLAQQTNELPAVDLPEKEKRRSSEKIQESV